MSRPNGRVLVVDDDHGVRETARSLLEALDWSVETLADGDAAVEWLASCDEPLVAALVDVKMPGRSGVETAVELRRRSPDLRIVLMSGMPEDDTDRCIAEGNADDFLQKPFRLADIRDVLAKADTRPDEPAG